MVTGIMEGANLSGDLHNPSKSLPLGTLLAVGNAILTYILLIIAVAGAFPSEVLQEDLNIFQNASLGTITKIRFKDSSAAHRDRIRCGSWRADFLPKLGTRKSIRSGANPSGDCAR